MNEVPASLRKLESEKRYNYAKAEGTLKPLSLENVKHQWKHWKLIENRFPYDMCFQTHDLLIPKRLIADKSELFPRELKELDSIIHGYCQTNYDMVFENMNKRRSVMALFHLHAATYYKNRSDFSL